MRVTLCHTYPKLGQFQLANWSGEKGEILEKNVKYIQLGGN